MEKDKMSTQLKSSICIAMPCYDSVKINTMLSIFQLIQLLGKGGIEVGINTMKSASTTSFLILLLKMAIP
jgi:hypothetical protein